jgi:DNA-binding NarL/FixJ family response regulator
MKEKHSMTVLIVASPGRWRDGLQAVVGALPQIRSVGKADDVPSALGAIAEHPPATVLLDAGLLEDDGCSALQRMHSTCPDMWRIVLVNSARDRRRVLMAGADAARAKGFSMPLLANTVARILKGV